MGPDVTSAFKPLRRGGGIAAVFFAEDGFGFFGDGFWFAHASEACFAACGVSHFWSDEEVFVLAEAFDVALCRGGAPHFGVHGGGEEDGFVGGEEERGGEVVGESLRGFRDEVGGCRRGDDEVCVSGELDMGHGVLVFLEEFVMDGVFGEGFCGEGCDEVFRGGGHDAGDGCAVAFEDSDEFQRFIGGDSAADDEEDIFLVEAVGHGGCGGFVVLWFCVWILARFSAPVKGGVGGEAPREKGGSGGIPPKRVGGWEKSICERSEA